MTPALALVILGIIDKSLTLAIKIHDDMPEDMRKAHWKRVDEDLQFWRGLFTRFDKEPDQ